MANSADPDQLASSEAQLIWIYTVCKGRVYPGSAGRGLNLKKTLIIYNEAYCILMIHILQTYASTFNKKILCYVILDEACTPWETWSAPQPNSRLPAPLHLVTI